MRILFSGGGTGGHINPAIAVARFVQSRRPEAVIMFAGAKNGMEEKLVPAEGFPLYTIEMSGITRSLTPKAIWHNIKSMKMLAVSGAKARKILDETCPDVVVGTGGYASFPFVKEAARRGIPTLIHESNALPGMSTRKLEKYAKKILLGFPEARELMDAGAQDKIIVTGNPLRPGMTVRSREDARQKLGIGDAQVVVSYFGSLGAREMNKLSARLMELEVKNGAQFRHIHSTGSFGNKWMPDFVRALGIDIAKQRNIDMREYINDMPDVMAAADLLICRAGAMTSSELCATGTPAVIIPSPNVADNHQEKNARALESRGAAVVILEHDVTPQKLYDIVTALLSDKERLKKMRESALGSAILDGDQRIYDAIVTELRRENE